VITVQPGHFTVWPGATVTFGVTVSGPGPFSYLWQHNGSGFAGSARTLTLSNVSPSDVGHYAVWVGNPQDQVLSSFGTLALLSLTYRPAGGIGTGTSTDNEAVLTLSGGSGDRYRIDYANSLGTNWALYNYVTTPRSLSDPFPTNSTMRFYRALYAP
jgi:hypothetical protein